MTFVNTFTFTFEELPLVEESFQDKLVEAALINGQVEVQYDRAGNWEIGASDISLDAYSGPRDHMGKPLRPYVAAPELIAGIILDRLNGSWGRHVYNAVQEQIASDREDAAEQRAEMRRDERMGL
jgi:hypothetical protein